MNMLDYEFLERFVNASSTKDDLFQTDVSTFTSEDELEAFNMFRDYDLSDVTESNESSCWDKFNSEENHPDFDALSDISDFNFDIY